MSSVECCAFSNDGQYLAYWGTEGKLKIWDTSNSRLKQEYTPESHLSSPCTTLDWISVNTRTTNTSPSPWKKRRRKSSHSEESLQKDLVAMGLANGSITLYDVSTASVDKQLKSGHSAAITALTWSPASGLFTVAEDKQIIEWSIQENGIKCKWKSGKGKVTAMAAMPDGKTLVTAEKIIKCWDLKTKQVICSFAGHSSQVISLNPIRIDSDTDYLISAASGERSLSVWSLNEGKKENSSIATLAMQDEVLHVSVKMYQDSKAMILATSRSGQAHLFKYQPNGRCVKPLKPTLNFVIASDSHKDSVHPIPILTGTLCEDEKVLLAFGGFLNLTLEKIVPDFSDKIQCLVRSDTRRSKERKEDVTMKIKATETEGSVEYHTPGTMPVKRNRVGASGSQLPLKDRLENLSLNAETTSSGSSPGTKGANMAQLLLQGLQSQDKNILSHVLYNRKENVIRNTIAKLPVQAITPLLKELTTMLQGKTYPSKIAVMWLTALISTHAAHLLSHPDIGEELGPILSHIDAKIMLLPELSKLKGRVSLVTGQVALATERDKDLAEESLLVYQDQDSSDESTDIGADEMENESDDSWEEISDQEQEDDVENGRSDDDTSICS